MESEEKEILKKLLKKVEHLEEELHKRDTIIQDLREQRGKPADLPQWQPLPKNLNDKLAKIIVRKARQKALEQAMYEQTPQGQMRKPKNIATAEEIRKNFSLGEIISFVFKNKIPIGNPEDSESSAKETSVIVKE